MCGCCSSTDTKQQLLLCSSPQLGQQPAGSLSNHKQVPGPPDVLTYSRLVCIHHLQVVAVAEALLETGALPGGGSDVGVVTPYNGQVGSGLVDLTPA
jgi:hypothetical protein